MSKSPQKPSDTLYKCVPVHWLSYPKPVRIVLGWITVLLYGWSFLTIPMCFLFLVPAVWRNAPVTAGILLGLVLLSMVMPLKEW